jgi:hypothetical protein
MFRDLDRRTMVTFATTIATAVTLIAPNVSAQRTARQQQRQQRQQRQDWDWDGNSRRLTRLNAGTYIPVRTTQEIESDKRESRFYSGVVNEDVWDDYQRLAVPAIPAGSRVNLVVREADDRDLTLDLESIEANGQLYQVSAQAKSVESSGRRRSTQEQAGWIGGGALLGAIVGSVAGGGKGAAIGAATGAAGGYGAMALKGRSVKVPRGSVITFRLDQPLDMRVARPRT